MKKLLFLLAGASMAASLASCDTKACKCYEYNGSGYIRVTNYIDEGNSCGTLDRYTNGKPTRICIEYNEPDIDPDAIGDQYKK